ncbi:FAD-dependent oxidoreductase [Nocardia sp. bgisy118]|uniref:FAD-dependent oxidoreductase n=1 Tax=Nocardia sp. bgisy118 TaxID=3413786 RepID=UPI003F49BB28
MTIDADITCDVLIIGAGLPGGSLARQLRLQYPELDIVVVEEATEFPSGLDEYSGEEFTNYANRMLKLGPHLRKTQIVGSGLRFFFDSPDHDLPLVQMSEIGGRRPHPIPTYLINRPEVERTLCDLNAASGVRVMLGTRVLHCEPGESPAEAITLDAEHGHLVRTSAGTIHCRWLVDAAGERSPLTRMLDLVATDDRNPIAAAWARFDGCHSLDDFDTEDGAWARRVPHWGRSGAMGYFLYRGYWIWYQPISATEYSVGVVYDRRHVEPPVRSGAELTAFLRGHRAVADLLGEGARQLSFGCRDNFARLSKLQFSADRWFLTGNAGTMLDPMFATTSWLFTENNKLIGEYIGSDMAGKRDEIDGMVFHFDIRLRSRYEKLLNTPGSYLFRGSFDAWSAWIALRTRVYYNRIVPDALEDHRIVLKFSRTHPVGCDCENVVMNGKLSRLLTAADRLTEEFVAILDQAGQYYDHNEGAYLDSAGYDQDPSLMAKVYEPRDWQLEAQEDVRAYAIFCGTLVHRLCELTGRPWSEEAFCGVLNLDWDSGQKLSEIFESTVRESGAQAVS